MTHPLRFHVLHFNSIKVQLKQLILFIVMLLVLFQFHKGTIKTKLLTEILVIITYFNSIKVQLKQQNLEEKYLQSVFQFHKGTIKTFAFNLSTHRKPIFQFHKGTIKTV